MCSHTGENADWGKEFDALIRRIEISRFNDWPSEIKAFITRLLNNEREAIAAEIETAKTYCHQDNFLFLKDCKDCYRNHQWNIVLADAAEVARSRITKINKDV